MLPSVKACFSCMPQACDHPRDIGAAGQDLGFAAASSRFGSETFSWRRYTKGAGSWRCGRCIYFKQTSRVVGGCGAFWLWWLWWVDDCWRCKQSEYSRFAHGLLTYCFWWQVRSVSKVCLLSWRSFQTYLMLLMLVLLPCKCWRSNLHNCPPVPNSSHRCQWLWQTETLHMAWESTWQLVWGKTEDLTSSFWHRLDRLWISLKAV